MTRHLVTVTHCPLEGYEYPRFDPGNTFSLDSFAIGLWDNVWPEGIQVEYRDSEWEVRPHVSHRGDGKTFFYQVIQNSDGKRYGPTRGPRQDGEEAPHTRLKRM